MIEMTGVAWVFLGCFIAAVVLLVIALVAVDEQAAENKRLRAAAGRRLLELEAQRRNA